MIYLSSFNVYADSASRICISHLTGNRLSGTVEWSTNKEEVEMALTADQASAIIEGFLAVMREREQAFSLDFNNPMFTDQDCLVWTGWTRFQFQSMLGLSPDHTR